MKDSTVYKDKFIQAVWHVYIKVKQFPQNIVLAGNINTVPIILFLNFNSFKKRNVYTLTHAKSLNIVDGIIFIKKHGVKTSSVIICHTAYLV